VFDGNTSDSDTVRKIVEKLESKRGMSNRVWVPEKQDDLPRIA
jgi:hypothetical protein